VLDAAFSALGSVVGRCCAGFRADLLVVGGSMAASWDLFEPAFRAGARGIALPPVVPASDPDNAPFAGAALHASRSGS
jgi:glucokinase